MAFITTTANAISSGGTISGDIVIDGDLTVNGDGAGNYDEIVNGELHVKITDTNAFLVEKADGTDVFTVDTTNSRVGIGIAPSHNLTVNNQIGVKRDGTNAYGTLTFTGAGFEIDQSASAYNPLIVKSNGTEIARFTSAGNLGIGMTPTGLLDIQATDNLKLRFYNSTNFKAGFELATSSGDMITGSAVDDFAIRSQSNLLFSSGGATERMRLDTSGNATFAGDVTTNERLIFGGTNDSIVASAITPHSNGFIYISGGSAGLVIGDDATNSRIQISNDAEIRHEIAGSEKMRLTSTGLGIGAISPVTMLNLKGDGTSIITLETSDTTQEVNNLTGAIYFRGNDATSGAGGTRAMIKANAQDSSGGHYMSFSTAPSAGTVAERVRIDMAGKVGIGTDSPASRLHVKETAGDEFFTFANSDGIGLTNNVASHGIGMSASQAGSYGGQGSVAIKLTEGGGSANAGTIKLVHDGNIGFIYKGGNVGIGTDSPVAKLEIIGSDGTVSGTPESDADELVIRNNARAGLGIIAGEGSGISSNVAFGSTSDIAGAMLSYTYTTKTMNLRTLHASGILTLGSANGVTALTLDTSQNATFAGDVALGGTTKGIDFSGSGKHIISGSGSGSYIEINNLGQIKPNSSSVYDLGASTHLWRDAYLKNGGRVYFGDTGTYVYGSSSLDVLSFAVGANERFKLDVNSRISLSNNDSGTSNTVFGKLAGDDLASGGNYNAFFGEGAGHAITTGDYNVAFGLNALDSSLLADRVTMIGTAAGRGVLTAAAIGSVGVGYAALNQNTEGEGNVAVGYEALSANINSDFSTAIGHQALKAQTGTAGTVGNTAVGYHSLTALTSGASNTMLGAYAGDAMTTSNDNVGIGLNAIGQATTQTDRVVAIGSGAMGGGISTADITGLVSIGYESLAGSLEATTDYTVAIGYQSLKSLTSGAQNTAVGYKALSELTAGNHNTALGYLALQTTSNATSEHNTAIGRNSMSGDWAGACSNNTAVGSNTMGGNMNASNQNTTIGQGGLSAITSGDSNVAVGYLAGSTLTTGGLNTYIGKSTVASAVDVQNEIILGSGITGRGTNTAVVGNDNVTDVYLSRDGGAKAYMASIQFPATQNASSDANALDDYEEGTWTPRLADASGNLATAASANGGTYTKVGRVVTANGVLATNGLGSVSGDVRLSGLPFTCANITYNYGVISVGHANGLAITAGNYIAGYNALNDTTAVFRVFSVTTGQQSLQHSQWTDDGSIVFSITYFSA